jgi:hypothetical protein
MDLTKFKKKAHTRTDPDISMGKPPWWKVYYDGYGGGKSMGAESYEGAIGGYLFVCSSTGDVHHKLYASHEQFPAALFQFLVHVESEGHRCHELYATHLAQIFQQKLKKLQDYSKSRLYLSVLERHKR